MGKLHALNPKTKSKKSVRTTTTAEHPKVDHEAIAKAILDRLFLSEDIPALVSDDVRELKYIEVSIVGIGALLRAIESAVDHEQYILMLPYFSRTRRLVEGIATAAAGYRFSVARRAVGAK